MKLSFAVRFLAVVSIAFVRTAFADTPPDFITEWGGTGTGPGKFIAAADLTSDPSGNIYVLDVQANNLQEFTNSGAYIGAFDHPTPYLPTAFALDPAAAIYIYDVDSQTIYVFSALHIPLRSWSANVANLAMDSAHGWLYASFADTITRYDANTGARLFSWLYPSSGHHYGFAVGPSSNIYVTNGYQVMKYGPDGSLLATWGSTGTGDGQFEGARSVAVDAAEHVYVEDGGNCRVQKFASDGTFLTKWGTCGIGPGLFSQSLIAITTDPAGDIFTLDSGPNLIQKFGYTATPTRRSTLGALKALYR